MRISLGLLLGILAACSSGPASTESEPLDVFGPYRGAEADAFAEALAQFELETGIEVNYTGSADFVGELGARLDGGVDAPDVAIISQPGLIDSLVAEDRLVPLSDQTRDAVDANYGQRVEPRSARDAYAAPYRSSIKSLIWYRPDVFSENGWTVPTTLTELDALVDDIASVPNGDSIAPWCFSIFSGTATGWAATDWVEDLLLREAGAEVYDGWVAGTRNFADPEVRNAFERFSELVLGTGRVVGGLPQVVDVDVDDGGAPLFGDLPGCALYKQASFATDWFPSEVAVGDDVDFFVMPGHEGPAPLVTGADHLVRFSDDDRVEQLLEYLVGPEGARAWAERGGYVSARTSVDTGSYYTDTDRRLAELLIDDRVARFDGSEAMPPEVGSALFWTEITKWIRGTTTLDEFLTTMDDERAALS